ncbi:hypothetical protein MN2019_23850 [Mycolicibacterium neoaurum]|nr:hypothetical protein MN2019_23850 [Mycolicibacterium neoaurum]
MRALAAALCTVGTGLAISSPPSLADVPVVYEVFSDSVQLADVTFYDRGVRQALNGVRLPWRVEVVVADALSPTRSGAELRADWRPNRAPAKWVTVRISHGDDVLCQSSLDIGNASCYGSTGFIS